MNQNEIMQIMQQFNKFKNAIKGKDIDKLYQEALNSGKYTPEQIENAKRMAEQYKIFLNL